MNPRNLWHCRMVWMLAAAVTACGRGDAPSPDASDAAAVPAGQTVDAATVSHITGSVALEGIVPANEPIKMNADPVCMRESKGPQQQETFVVGAGGALANVFVYVKDGLDHYAFAHRPSRPRLTRKGAGIYPTCLVSASASRSRSSTAIRPCITSTRCPT
jgi:hypothetical protein